MIVNNQNFDFEAIKDRPVYTLSCREFCALTRYAQMGMTVNGSATPSSPQAVGIAALADALSCSPSQVATMRRDGVLDGAIKSYVGRRIVFDVDKARAAANTWHAGRKNNKPAEVAG